MIERPQYGLTAAAAKSGDGIRFVRITDIQDHRIDWNTVPACALPIVDPRYLLRDQDLLVARIGATTGKAFLVRQPPSAVYASYLLRVRATGDLDPQYLAFFFRTQDYRSQIESLKGGRLKGGVTIPNIESLTVPLPDMAVQRAIAANLAKFQEAIDIQERIVATLKELKAATVAKLFREGLRDEPLKQTEIGEIPESWDLVTMTDAVAIVEGQVDPKVEPYRSMVHVGPDSIEPETGRLLHAAKAAELGLISGKYLFSVGDIVYSKIRPYLEKVWVSTFDGICSADMYPLRARRGFETAFVAAYLLTMPFTNQVTAQQSRTGIPKVNRDQLSRCLVPKPDVREQFQIAAVSLELQRAYEHALERWKLLAEFFDSSLNGMMSGELHVQSEVPS